MLLSSLLRPNWHALVLSQIVPRLLVVNAPALWVAWTTASQLQSRRRPTAAIAEERRTPASKLHPFQALRFLTWLQLGAIRARINAHDTR